MIRKLPAWVWVGGFVLATMAGLMNAVAVLGMQHQAVSHLTGSSTNLGVALGQFDLSVAGPILVIIACFVGGAILSGMIVGDSTLKLGRRYGGALVVEAVLVLLAIPLLQRNLFAGDCLISAACGLQNAMASTYSGAIIRTTHVTGIFTDIGITLGHYIRGDHTETRKLALFIAIAIGFIGGGALGAWLYADYREQALLLPGLLLGAAGGAYWWYTHRRRIADRLLREVHE